MQHWWVSKPAFLNNSPISRPHQHYELLAQPATVRLRNGGIWLLCYVRMFPSLHLHERCRTRSRPVCISFFSPNTDIAWSQADSYVFPTLVEFISPFWMTKYLFCWICSCCFMLRYLSWCLSITNFAEVNIVRRQPRAGHVRASCCHTSLLQVHIVACRFEKIIQ